jgi:LacI family transcriptional regulator
MPASVKDVAALAKVSASTVSNYLNHPHLLGEASRERVRQAIAELGFVPNESARQLRAGTGKLLAVSLIDAWQPYFAELSRGVEDEIRATPWSLMFSNSNRDAQQERDNLDMFEAHRVQGVVIYPQGEVTARLERLAERGVKSVVVGPPHTSPRFASVPFDDRGGGRLAGAHLVATGRRRIAYLGNPDDVAQSAERLSGLRDGLAASGGEASVSTIAISELSVEAGIRAAERLLALPRAERPDAVFAANDVVAVGALTCFLRHGVEVPGEIALVGFDDIALAHQAVVPLTTIRQPGYEMGRAAARLLLEQLEHPSAPPPQLTPFAAELVVRQSTPPIAG